MQGFIGFSVAQGDNKTMNLQDITIELVAMRKTSASDDMRKAELFAQVKEEKLYKEDHDTFANFCDSVGYHRSSVYLLVRCWQEEKIRNVYTKIGSLKSHMIMKAQKHITENEFDAMIAFALTSNASDVKAEIDRIKAEKLIDVEIEPEADEDLRKLMERKGQLLTEKRELEREIGLIDQVLNELETKILSFVE